MKSVVISCLVRIGFACGFGAQESFDQMVNRMTKGTVAFIRTEELSAKISARKCLLLDTRQKSEFNVSHIPGAIWVGEQSWSDSLYKVARNYTLVVCYCSVGHRSEKCGEWLQSHKVSNVKNLYGGIFDWANKGNRLLDAKGKVTRKVHPYNARWSKWIKQKDRICYE